MTGAEPRSLPAISVTFDLEDHRPSPTWEARYPEHIRKLLDFCDERSITATVFVVGRVAERSPELVQEVAARGHEVGIHNYEHWPLFSSTPSSLAERTSRAKGFVEDLIGQPVNGFRAPAGTLIPKCYWATEVLRDVGFTYSASVLPFQTYGVGFPGCPASPFRWPSGLIESPCPAVGVGPVGLPFMGGTFLRVFPSALATYWARHLDPAIAPWTYLHPYDIDVMEPFWLVSDVNWWGSLLLWVNRGHVLRKLDAVLAGRDVVGLGARLAELDARGALPEYDPTIGWSADAAAGAARGPLDSIQRYLRKERVIEAWSPPEHMQPGELASVAASRDPVGVAG